MFKRSLARLVLLLVLCLGFAAPLRAAEYVADRIVAVINGQIITDFEVRQQVKYATASGQVSVDGPDQLKALRRQIIDQMITDILLEQEAQHYGIKVSDSEVNAAIRDVMERTGMNEEQLRKELAVQGLTWEKFFENKRTEIKKRSLVAGLVKVVVSEDELQQAFDEKHGKAEQGDYLHLRIILLPEGMSAAAVKRDIESGKMTFAKAAEVFSQGPGADQGGDLGVVARKDLAAEWGKALDGVAVGGVSKPFRIQSQEALLYIDSVAEAPTGDFEAEKNQLYEMIYTRKMETFLKEYLDKLREKAVIEYRD